MMAQLRTQPQRPRPQSFLPMHRAVLQRKCACGGTPGPTGECPGCAKKKKLFLQRKLMIGASNDPLEDEADRVADQLLAAPAHRAVNGTPGWIHRVTTQPTGTPDKAPASVDQVLSRAGRPLDAALKRDMEQRFGHDFSQVRVHSDAAAGQSAREINANAYTVRHNMVFAGGQFMPGTKNGRRLIAHELTHVVQQRGLGGVRVDQRDDRGGRSSIARPISQSAEWMRESVVEKPAAQAGQQKSTGIVQLQPAPSKQTDRKAGKQSSRDTKAASSPKVTITTERPKSADEISQLIAILEGKLLLITTELERLWVPIEHRTELIDNRIETLERQVNSIDTAIKALKVALVMAKWEEAHRTKVDLSKPLELPSYTMPSDQYSGIENTIKQRYGLTGAGVKPTKTLSEKRKTDVKKPLELPPYTMPSDQYSGIENTIKQRYGLTGAGVKPTKTLSEKRKTDVKKPLELPSYTMPSDQYSGIENTIKQRYKLTGYRSSPSDFINYHKGAIDTPFFWSGGSETGFDFFDEKSWNTLGVEVPSNPKTPASEPGLTNDYSALAVSEGITPDNFVNLMLGRFITGVGPENFVFPLNGAVSNEMRDSPIVKNVIQKWHRENYEAILSGGPLRQTLGGHFGRSEQVELFLEKWGLLNVPQLVGSATVTVIPLVKSISNPNDLFSMKSGDELLITVKNVTSATSGDILKHFDWLGFGTAPSFPKDTLNPKRQHYTNISQTFQFTMKVNRSAARFLKEKQRWAEETK